MTGYLIDSRLELLEGTLPSFTDYEVKNEPMLFNCDLAHALSYGGPISGPITNAFLHTLPSSWKDVPLVIDSRVHMLMPGFYPCIPGWHHDDVPRTRADGQPDYRPGWGRSEHIMALVNAHLAPTEFALGEGWFREPELGRTVYADWHREVERRFEERPSEGSLVRWSAPDRRLIKFSDRTWHRGTAAVGTGWRFFIRASRYFDANGNPIARGNARTNEVRRQVQVYLDNVNQGW